MIRFCVYSIIISCFAIQGFAQTTWQQLSDMPMAVGNNAVTQAHVGDTTYVYSFGGIDSTKMHEGITKASMRYNTITDFWSFIPDLPDTLGKIASAASTIDNIIYITGGYHVFSGFPFELSSDKIHRFDPEANIYLTDGAPMPHAIDDHVQAVWRDSLLFMITGWSDTGNVPYVQIYNPSLDSWQEGNSTPNNALYKAFGASGAIIGDTIFYNGGAAGSSFNSTGKMRRGIIDAEDPTNITWDLLEDNPGDKGYRMAAVSLDQQAIWIGGSGVTYNYDGIAYNGTGGVPPLHRILSFNKNTEIWTEELDQPFGVMDLRGAAQISENSFIICGGMIADQVVSNHTYLITLDFSVGLSENTKTPFLIYPNPIGEGEKIYIQIDEGNLNNHVLRYTITNSLSQILVDEEITKTSGIDNIIKSDDLVHGNYFLHLFMQNGEELTHQFVINK